MTNKCITSKYNKQVDKILNYVLYSEKKSYSISDLNNVLGTSVSECRTLLKWLYALDIVYSKVRIGYFVNLEYLESLDFENITLLNENDSLRFVNDKIDVEIFNFQEVYDQKIIRPKINYEPDQIFIKLVTILIFFHTNNSIFYSNEVSVKGEELEFCRKGIDERLGNELYIFNRRLKSVSYFK